MSERDIHFASWAKLQIQKLQEEGLLEAWNPDFGEIDLEKVQRATQLLTQGAYDLVAYSVGCTGVQQYDPATGYASGSIEEVIVRDIPDLTEWPVEPDEFSRSNPA